MSEKAEMLRSINESLSQLVRMNPVAIRVEGVWDFFPSADMIEKGAYFRERVLEMLVDAGE